MARCLIIGCGCRGQLLASRLRAAGHLVRGTTRDPRRLPAIEASGAEAVLAGPDRIATVVDALRQVSAVVILLGSAAGSQGQIAALHGSRLEMLLSKLTDTTVRGVVYEAEGNVEPAVLAAGAARVSAFAEENHARCEVLADSVSAQRWLDHAVAAVERVLVAR